MKIFGELTKQEQMDLFEAWLDGSIIEFCNIRNIWYATDHPSWEGNLCYRIKPTKPSINWDHVSDDLGYLIRDNNTHVVCQNEPTFDGRTWKGYSYYIPASAYKSFKPGTCKPEDSLVTRPGYK